MVGSLKRVLQGWLVAAVACGVCAAQTLASPPPSLAPIAPTTILGSAQFRRQSRLDHRAGFRAQGFLSLGAKYRRRDRDKTGDYFRPGRVRYFPTFRRQHVPGLSKFPRHISLQPGDWKDLLDLWIGRVKIYIQKFGNQPNPNRIFTPTAVISVRGTIFDVAIEDDQDTTLVSVEEGQVHVHHRLIGYSKDKDLSAGEYLRVYKDAPIAKHFDTGGAVQRGLRAAADALYTHYGQRRGAPGTRPPTGSGGPNAPETPAATNLRATAAEAPRRRHYLLLPRLLAYRRDTIVLRCG